MIFKQFPRKNIISFGERKWIFILPFLESWWYIYQIIQGNYAYQPDWKEKNDLRSSYKKFYIAVLIGFPFSFPESILCSLDVSWRKIQPI